MFKTIVRSLEGIASSLWTIELHVRRMTEEVAADAADNQTQRAQVLKFAEAEHNARMSALEEELANRTTLAEEDRKHRQFLQDHVVRQTEAIEKMAEVVMGAKVDN